MKHLDRYIDFILESIGSGNIRLYYSEEFRSLLKRTDNTLSKFLLNAENSNQISDSFTLIDITDKNDQISFIQTNRIRRKLNQETDSDEYKSDELTNIITNKSRNSEFWREGRTEMNIGRWLRRIIGIHKINVIDKEIEKFVNTYKYTHDSTYSDINFQLVKGADIRKWYLSDYYEKSTGQLGNSCMRYRNCQNYLDIYVNNPEVCNLLILKSMDGNTIKGRSLIWKLRDGRFYQDRIYTNYDSDSILFQRWAESNGMVSNISSDIFVDLGNYTYENYPYMDTFICYNPDTKVLSNDESLWPSQGYIKLQDTGGGYESDDVVWSNYYGEHIPRESSVMCENGDWVFKEDAVYLKYRDEWHMNDYNICFSVYHGEYFLEEDAPLSSIIGDYFCKEYDDIIGVEINSDGDLDYIPISRDEFYIKLGDRYIYKKVYIKDPYDGEYKFIDEKSTKKYLRDKIGNDLEISKLLDVENKVIDIFKNESYNKSKAIDMISSNKKFKDFKKEMSKYKLLFSEDDILMYMFINIIKDIYPISYLDIQFIFDIMTRLDKQIDIDLYRKKSQGLYNKILEIINSLDYSIISDDIYKLYLYNRILV
jgi:hypothetical protein